VLIGELMELTDDRWEELAEEVMYVGVVSIAWRALFATAYSKGLLRRRVQLGQFRTKRAMSSLGTQEKYLRT